jgi:Arabinose-binding domain of AraC transcription regulator, N-term
MAASNRFRVASTLPRKLEELGVPPADVLRQAGLPNGLFDQDRILVSTEELFALYRGLGQASPDPAIGLKLGTEPRIERYDPIAIAAVSARSFRDALQRLGRYTGDDVGAYSTSKTRRLSPTHVAGNEASWAISTATLSPLGGPTSERKRPEEDHKDEWKRLGAPLGAPVASV